MKYISRLTALLVALLVLCANIAGAEEGSVDSSALTEDQLASWYALTAEGTTVTIDGDVLGWEVTLPGFGSLTEEDLASHSLQWWNAVTSMPIEGETANEMTVTWTMEEQQYYCIATDASGNESKSDIFVVAAAQTTDYEQYLSALASCYDDDDYALYRKYDIYEYMTETWNITLSDGTNLAQNVIDLWWSTWSEDALDADMLCLCVVNNLKTSEYCMLSPGADHDSTCGWAKLSTITDTDISKPDKLLGVESIILTSPVVSTDDDYRWQQYIYDEETGEWAWVTMPDGNASSHSIEVSLDSIQSAYRLVYVDTEGYYTESAPLYLGGEKFFTWVTSTQTLSNGETTVAISDWLSIEGMTLEYVVAAFNASAKGITLDEAIYVDVDAAEPALLELFGLSALATYDPATNYLTDVRYHIPVAVYDPATNTITQLTITAAN